MTRLVVNHTLAAKPSRHPHPFPSKRTIKPVTHPDDAGPNHHPNVTSAPAPLWRFGAIGLVAGLASGMFGVGGGIVMVPLLIMAGRLDQRHASATSLLAIVPTAVVGATSYAARGQIAWVAGVIVGVGAMAGAWVGARILRVMALAALRWGFVALLAAVATWMVFYVPVRGAQVTQSAGVSVAMAGLGLAMGLGSALFGIGGGLIGVPALMGLFGAGDLVARGTSLLIMIPTAIVGTATNWRSRLVMVRAGLVTGTMAALASWAGGWLAGVIAPRAGNLLFAGLLTLAAAQLALSAWRARGSRAAS
ncbi:MAG: sulfite exporter TauE/SafE family protein [Bifidobacteriaceae bacterium]|nr:sulfite exporter TauE/SafE family protein [Bifidobacteriaceae bacterium]